MTVTSWVIGALLLAYAVTPAFAATTDRHVASTGADTGDCATASAPCRTITYALTQAIRDDTIVVGPGEYREHVEIIRNGITIEGDGPSATTVIGTPCVGNSTFDVRGLDVTLRGLAIGGCPEGVVVVAGHVIVENDLFVETTGIAVSLAGGSATVRDTVFRSAGGVADRSVGSAVVTGNTFLTQDFGVGVNFADATVHHNRLTTEPDIGVNIEAGANADLNDNWWGCNGGPNEPGCARLVAPTTVVDGWLRLEPVTAPTTARPGEIIRLSFGMVGSRSRALATDFPAAPVAFSTTAGSVDPITAVIRDGVATTTFTAPAKSGVYTVSASLDGETASATFNAPAAPSSPPTARPQATSSQAASIAPSPAPGTQTATAPAQPPQGSPSEAASVAPSSAHIALSVASPLQSAPPTVPAIARDGTDFLPVALAAIGILAFAAFLIRTAVVRRRR
jgi:hypothetical protein